MPGFDLDAAAEFERHIIEPGEALGAGQRDGARHLEAQLRRRHAQLEGRTVRGIAEQVIADGQRKRIHGPALGDAEVTMAAPTEILHGGLQRRFQDDDHGRFSSFTNFTVSPGSSSDGAARSGSNRRSEVRPMSCQPPGDANG